MDAVGFWFTSSVCPTNGLNSHLITKKHNNENQNTFIRFKIIKTSD